MMDDLNTLAGRVRYLVKLADWASGQGFCKIEGIEDPDEWLCDLWGEIGPANGDGYSAEAVADAILAPLRAHAGAKP